MQRFSLFLATLGLFFCSACTSFDGLHKSLHNDAPKETGFTNKECDTEADVSNYLELANGWNPCSVEMAAYTFLYAQMSENAYLRRGNLVDNPPAIDPTGAVLPDDREASATPVGRKAFQIVGGYEFQSRNESPSESGLAFDVYHRRENGLLEEVVVAFRGTQGIDNRADQIDGNLSPVQRREALTYFDEIANAALAENEEVKLTVTGHSLGGSLAIQISLCYDVYQAVVFQTSPRYRKSLCKEYNGSDAELYENNIYHVTENREVNRYFRFLGIVLGDPVPRVTTTYNCLVNQRALADHNITRGAKCLTQIASYSQRTRELALRSIEINDIIGQFDGYDLTPKSSNYDENF